MEISIQIQSIKSQIENMQLQIDNIEIQYHNNMNMAINNLNNQIYEQLLNLSIQMMNTGIQSFNAGKNMVINKDKFYGKLQIISEQINKIINDDIQMKMMFEQYMMMKQQQEMMKKQQEMGNQMPNNHIESMNVEFTGDSPGLRIINVKLGTTIEELLDKYINKYYEESYPKIKILFNGYYLQRNDQRKVENVFKHFDGNLMSNPKILVLQVYKSP